MTRNGLTAAGQWVRTLRDRIDRRWMAHYNDLPEMPEPADPMRCGGCGAKVGASVLTRTLSHIVPAQRPEILVGLDVPEDAAVIDNGGPFLTVQTVAYFRAMIAGHRHDPVRPRSQGRKRPRRYDARR